MMGAVRTIGMYHRTLRRGSIAACLVAVAATLPGFGCSPFAPRLDPSRFYVLAPMDQLEPGARGAAPMGETALRLGLGPIRIREYLDRAQLVTRAAPNRIVLSEVDRWGEPLRVTFAGALAENLTLLLGTDKLVMFPWYRTTKLDYAVGMEVRQFESDGRGTVAVVISWSIRDGNDSAKVFVRRDFVDTRQARSRDSEATVLALSEALADLSREIAAALRELGHPRSR